MHVLNNTRNADVLPLTTLRASFRQARAVLCNSYLIYRDTYTHTDIGTAVAPGRSPTEVTCDIAGTAGYSEHLDYTIHSFVIKCILTKRTKRVRGFKQRAQCKPSGSHVCALWSKGVYFDM